MNHDQVYGYRSMTVGGERTREHRLVAEAVLGTPLPSGAVVHHHGDTLVICEDQKYHMLLHVRMRALAACGDPNWRRCRKCKQYDSQFRLIPNERKGYWTHRGGCP